MSRGRRYTFTLNNPQCLLEELYHPSLMSYLVAGEETAPSTGTRHYQGYMETHSKKHLTALAKDLTVLWKSRPHLLISKGSAEQNKKYCLKENGSHVEQGSPMQQGARTDLASVTSMIVNGSTIQELWQTQTEMMIRYGPGIQRAYTMLSPNVNQMAIRTFEVNEFPYFPTEEIRIALESKAVILWGDSGIGKTCYARALLPRALFVSHYDDLIRYDSGEHDGIIFDDMSMMHLPRESQIHLLDYEQPRSVHIRYQTAHIPAGTKKIFTTNNAQGRICVEDPATTRRVATFRLSIPDNSVYDMPLDPWAEFALSQ